MAFASWEHRCLVQRGVRFVVSLSFVLAAAAAFAAEAPAPVVDTTPPPGVEEWRWQAHLERLYGPTLVPRRGPERTLEDPARLSGTYGASGVATDGQWNSIPPPTLWLHTTLYDPQRDRLVVFGGANYRGVTNEVWQLAMSGAPRWTRLQAAGGGPTARSQHTAIYDSVRDRMIVFGGNDGTDRNDVWALSLAAPATWTPLQPSGTGPTPRSMHGAIYDVANDRMIVYGGTVGLTRINEVWALNLSSTPQWVKLNPTGTGPGARSHLTCIYDAPRQRMVFFGGVDAFGQNKTDTWALTLGATPSWVLVAAAGSGPGMRTGSSAIYDPLRQRMVIFAGGTGAPNLNETWSLSLSGTPAWTQLTQPSMPQGRQHHTAVYDPIGDRMLVYGGSNGPILGDTWVLALSGTSAWAPLSGTRRRGHTAFYDPVRHAMGVFGGENGTTNNDVWTLSLAEPPAWTKLNPSGTLPAPRAFHVAGYDPLRDRLIIFGGRDAAPRNDVWELSMSGAYTWRQLLPEGTAPSARIDAAGIYDPVRHRLIVIGGSTGGTVSTAFVLNDVWVLSLSGSPTWTRIIPSGTAPAERGAAAIAYDAARDRILLYGGYDINLLALDDMWSLSLSGTPAWTRLYPAGTPPAGRFASSMNYDPVRDRVVLFGGTDLIDYFADTWEVTLGGLPTWRNFSVDGVLPLQRSDHQTILDPVEDRLVLYGGEGMGGSYLNDTWELRLASLVDVPQRVPVALHLGPVTPNPSRGESRIAFDLPRAGAARLEIFDLAGRLVRTIDATSLNEGPQTVRWDGRGAFGETLAAGVYFYQVSAGGERQSGKLVRIE